MWAKVMFIGPNIVTLTVLHTFHIKSVILVFDPLKASKVKSDCVNWKPMVVTKKSSPGSNLVSVTVFKIFRINGLWPWPLTSQGHPKWSPWVQHRNSCRSSHISRQNVRLFYPFAISYGWDVISGNLSKSAFFEGWVTLSANFRRKGTHQPLLASEN